MRLDYWHRIANLAKEEPVFFAIVVDNIAHSPGTKGVRLFASDSKTRGTIGGGIMEYELLQRAQKMRKEGTRGLFLEEKIHRENEGEKASGLFCAGAQTLLFGIIYTPEEVNLLSKLSEEQTLIIQNEDGVLTWSVKSKISEAPFSWLKETKLGWRYEEQFFNPFRIAIIGSGHCGLALSQVMQQLGYYVESFDIRQTRTVRENCYADLRLVEDYSEVGRSIRYPDFTHVVVMTADVGSDMAALGGLDNLDFPYVGVMGSQTKITKIRQQISGKMKETLRAPIGLKIGSHTPAEIAISISAEILSLRSTLFPWTRARKQ